MSATASNVIKLQVKNTFDKDVQLMSSDKEPSQGLQVRQLMPVSLFNSFIEN